MPAWNDAHYRRAEEFVRAIADTVPAPLADAAPAPPVISPAPTSASMPPATPSAAPAPTPATPAPALTAASVFKKMPWKK